MTPLGWLEAPANPRSGDWRFHQEFDLVSAGYRDGASTSIRIVKSYCRHEEHRYEQSPHDTSRHAFVDGIEGLIIPA